MKQSQSRSSKIDVKSRHRCWLESFLRADWNHKAAETVWQRHTLQFHCSTVCSFGKSLCKRAVLIVSIKDPCCTRLNLLEKLQHVLSLQVMCKWRSVEWAGAHCSQIISTCFMSRWKSGITVWWDIGVPKVPFHFSKKREKKSTIKSYWVQWPSFIWLICLGVLIIKKDTYRRLNSVIISHQMLDLPLLTRCPLVYGC